MGCIVLSDQRGRIIIFIEERHQAILDMLGQAGRITTGEIQQRFGISYDSAKRDLRILEEKGLLKRTHGGAIMIRSVGWSGQTNEKTGKERAENVKDNYLDIAKRAIKEIGSQEVVYVTAASVGYLMAQNMPDDQIFTVVTNSIAIAEELRKKGNITVILAGGEMSANGSFYDGFSMEILKRLHFDKCFITSACISAKGGLSVQKSKNMELLNTVIQNSRKVYGLYPVEKIGMDSVISICGLDSLDVLITDEEASEEDVRVFEDAGVTVIVARKEMQE